MNRNSAIAIIAIVIIALSAIGAWYFTSPASSDSGKPEAITVAWSPYELGALFWIADDQHFFENNGLTISTKKYFSGVASLDAVLNGEADITVGVGEFPLATKVAGNPGVRVIGTIDKSDIVYLIARKDRIANASELKGKKIGTAKGTAAEFYLGRFLTLHGMGMKDITLVDVKTPDGWVNEVASGSIDAMVIGQPYANAARDRLGDNAIVFPAQGNQPFYALALSTAPWLAQHPVAAEKFLRSLAQAEVFASAHPSEAKGIVVKKVGLDPGYLDTAWEKNQFSLSLDSSLITAMEDETRWMIANKLTNETTVPDFRNYFYTKGLDEVKPGSVQIIG